MNVLIAGASGKIGQLTVAAALKPVTRLPPWPEILIGFLMSQDQARFASTRQT